MGGKEMIEVLKTMTRRWRNLSLSFFKTLYHWTVALDFNVLSPHYFLDLTLSFSKLFIIGQLF
jgi:hypothetical protein